eukprot:TRINITY_DN8325_c0_g1_i1.p1 TRINITY_DN8325_c0_g1~~TRINITY_DN8325_c0_g1_i1.p1  ORF type:complete len:229 (-),score=82.88 TRINITY_DN8325_c0_g1_i1:108-734(-)
MAGPATESPTSPEVSPGGSQPLSKDAKRELKLREKLEKREEAARQIAEEKRQRLLAEQRAKSESLAAAKEKRRQEELDAITGKWKKFEELSKKDALRQTVHDTKMKNWAEKENAKGYQLSKEAKASEEKREAELKDKKAALFEAAANAAKERAALKQRNEELAAKREANIQNRAEIKAKATNVELDELKPESKQELKVGRERSACGWG